MAGGTRFRLYPQYAAGYTQPELVEVGPGPGRIGPGPQDAVMYVANPLDKAAPYHVPTLLPPYTGLLHPPALPGPDGHFDHIAEDRPQFRGGTSLRRRPAGARYLADLLDSPIVWWHADAFPLLELVPNLRWGNAHSGPGFLETGFLWTRSGVPQSLCLNFDVVAHEMGHAILFSALGVPRAGQLTGAFLALHECFADHVAAISALHFNSVVSRLLAQTNGNLYSLNFVSRLGELSDNEQVRVLDNNVTLSKLGGLRLGPDGRWIDPLGLGRRQHAAAAPLNGALWDCFVDVFQEALVARGAIGRDLDTRGSIRAEVEASLAHLERASGAALARFAGDFAAAIREARDLIGFALARCIGRLSPDDLDFAIVAARLCEAMAELGRGHLLPALIENFLLRDIDPRPLLGRAPGGWRPNPGAAVEPLIARQGTTNGGVRSRTRDQQAIAAVNRLIGHPHRAAAALAGG